MRMKSDGLTHIGRALVRSRGSLGPNFCNAAPTRLLSSSPAGKTATRQWSTPLAKVIADAINATGPLSIAAYMRQCLTSPQGGYYTTRDEVLGSKGDFITSPEISQVFGELLGIWTAAQWITQGKRDTPIDLIEIGPGKGTLMADILRSVRNFKFFSSKIHAIYLVESSPVLREIQRQKLCGDSPLEETDIGHKSTSSHLGVPVIWTEHLGFVPKASDKTPFIFAHEFFDALPIHAFQSVASTAPRQPISTLRGPELPKKMPSSNLQSQSSTQWRELVVTQVPEDKTNVKSKDKHLEFQLSLANQPSPSSLVMPETSERYRALKPAPGLIIEISPESQTYAQEIARRIGGPFSETEGKQPQAPSGAALIIDYGTMSTIPINSLRGISKHRLVSPFERPGEVDLSADVDFNALAEAAIEASPGVEVYGPVEQGAFLQTLGIQERAAQLLRHADNDEVKKRIEDGWKRLTETGGGGMGRIYKAMAIVPESGGKRRPVGFGGSIA